ncbi:hypothetical protein DFH11DRAFT_1275706 [Phellopilus nigrolimitatus]|nr:hypothetical protein DFH11DRAFT_1275706 [Phellopilus nigrolimitatus]
MRYGRLRTSFFALASPTTLNSHACFDLFAALNRDLAFSSNSNSFCNFESLSLASFLAYAAVMDRLRLANIVSRRGMTGWCKQSVERLLSRQTQSKILSVCKATLSWERYPTRRRWNMRARTPRPQCAKCSEAARSARELCGIDSASEEESDGSILET